MRPSQFFAVVIVGFGFVPLLANCTPADSPGLVGHWKLAGNTRDDSDQAHHGTAYGVDFGADGPDGKPNGAAKFDGRTSRIEIANRASLQLGSDDFSIALWVNTAGELDDGCVSRTVVRRNLTIGKSSFDRNRPQRDLRLRLAERLGAFGGRAGCEPTAAARRRQAGRDLPRILVRRL